MNGTNNDVTARLGARLRSSLAGAIPVSDTNGAAAPRRDAETEHKEIADAAAFLGRSEGGRAVLKLVALLTERSVDGLLNHKRVLDVLSKENAGLKAELAWVKENMLLDGGTWKPDKAFVPRDMTTYRGKQWICRRSNTNVRPGTSDHWRLTEKYQHEN